MRAGSKAIAVLMLTGLLAAGVAYAQAPQAQESKAPDSKALKTDELTAQDPKLQNPTPPPRGNDSDVCEVPNYLMATESSLSKVGEAIKTRQRLEILVVGTASSVLAGPEGASKSYPARLEAVLREKLAGITVNVTTNLQVKKTAAEVAEALGNLAKQYKPTLVIWQTGTIDALRSVDPDDFRAAIDDGTSVLLAAGTDVLLMNLQYSPRMETMITVAPYLDNMRVSAQEHDVPLFDRFAMMRYWNESGRFDLFNPSHGLGLAMRVHDCLGQALASFVIDAARINTAELRIQR